MQVSTTTKTRNPTIGQTIITTTTAVDYLELVEDPELETYLELAISKRINRINKGNARVFELIYPCFFIFYLLFSQISWSFKIFFSNFVIKIYK